jgi:hypothetical protein
LRPEKPLQRKEIQILVDQPEEQQQQEQPVVPKTQIKRI